MRPLVLVALLLLTTPALRAQPPDLWTGFDHDGYELATTGSGYQLRRPEGEPVTIPREWLSPAAVREQEEEMYVSSLAWGRPVTAFPLGDGRIGLHLSSYTIAKEGSAMAAAGRDLFLLLEPRSRQLRLGLDLGETKGRVRVDGCFTAWFQRLYLGDVDCDGRLDLAAREERVACNDDENEEETPYLVPSWVRGELRWFVLGAEGWTEKQSLENRLACFGMRELPPLGLERSPVEWVLERLRFAAPLLPPRGLTTPATTATPPPPR